jgi:hypothetical protein
VHEQKVPPKANAVFFVPAPARLLLEVIRDVEEDQEIPL